MFISIFKSEVYHKLRPESQSKELLFHFNYGQSFFLYVIGFVVVELSGILNVCLFNKLQKQTQQSQLNNYVKVGVAKSESSAAPKMCQHRVAFPSIVEN
ncbi:CLUMA_CG017328, isoform A, partial [Clunio marinus]